MNLTPEQKQEITKRALNNMVGKDYFLVTHGGSYVKVIEVVDNQTVIVTDKYGGHQNADIYDLRAV